MFPHKCYLMSTSALQHTLNLITAYVLPQKPCEAQDKTESSRAVLGTHRTNAAVVKDTIICWVVAAECSLLSLQSLIHTLMPLASKTAFSPQIKLLTSKGEWFSLQMR